MPEVEKLNRVKAFSVKYPGIMVSGTSEPSSTLIEFAQMVKVGQVRFLPLSKLLSREDEVTAKKRAVLKCLPVKWSGDSTGILATADVTFDAAIELTSDYLVRQALLRRSIATHMADFLAFDKIAETYFKRLYEPAPQ
eukprot:5166720-Amphidinium_carterae.1